MAPRKNRRTPSQSQVKTAAPPKRCRYSDLKALNIINNDKISLSALHLRLLGAIEGVILKWPQGGGGNNGWLLHSNKNFRRISNKVAEPGRANCPPPRHISKIHRRRYRRGFRSSAGVRTLGYILLLGCWLPLRAQPLPPYPDNSPTLTDWAHMRVPTDAPAWQAADYQQLTRILDQLLPLDKTSLPRADSPYSGPLFERLVSFPLPDPTADLPTRLLAYERLKELPGRFLLYYYEPNRPVQRFGAEVLQLHLAEWAVRQYGLHLFSAARAAYPQPQIAQQHRRELAAATLAVRALFHLLEVEHAQYAPTALHDVARQLYYLVSDIPDVDLRTEVAQRLRTLARSHPDPELCRLLRRCSKVCK